MKQKAGPGHRGYLGRGWYCPGLTDWDFTSRLPMDLRNGPADTSWNLWVKVGLKTRPEAEPELVCIVQHMNRSAGVLAGFGSILIKIGALSAAFS